jgi:hypothetical protein
LARRINTSHVAAIQAAGAAIEFAIECGRALIEAKSLVGHGNWLPWLKENTTVSYRTASRWMRYTEHAEELLGKLDTMADLTFAEADQLLASPRATSSWGPLDKLIAAVDEFADGASQIIDLDEALERVKERWPARLLAAPKPADKSADQMPQAESSLPENASGDVRAFAGPQGVTLPDAGATDVTAGRVGEVHADPITVDPRVLDVVTEPAGELHPEPVDLSLALTADTEYKLLQRYLLAARKSVPHFPSAKVAKAMPQQRREDLRRRAERLRAWAEKLVQLLDATDSGGG